MSFVVGRVACLTCLDNNIYLLYFESDVVHVFTADMLDEVSFITVDGLQYPTDIVACHDDHQLYVSDWLSSIWRVSAVNPSDSENWVTDDKLCGFCTLSVTSQRLLVTSHWYRRLHQYSTTDRKLLRVIKLRGSVEGPTHAVETSRGTFVFCSERPRGVSESKLFSFITFIT